MAYKYRYRKYPFKRRRSYFKKRRKRYGRRRRYSRRYKNRSADYSFNSANYQAVDVAYPEIPSYAVSKSLPIDVNTDQVFTPHEFERWDSPITDVVGNVTKAIVEMPAKFTENLIGQYTNL